MTENEYGLSLDYILDDEPTPPKPATKPAPTQQAPVVTETVFRPVTPVTPVTPVMPVAAASVAAAPVAVAPLPTPVATQAYSSPYAGQNVNFFRMLKSEWLKFWTLRSTWWVVLLTILLMAGFALLFATVLRTTFNNIEAGMAPGGGDMMMGDPEAAAGGMANFLEMLSSVNIVTIGLQFAQLTVAVLGVLMITNEYSSGMIRATFSAAPHRGRVLLAKLIVLLTTTALLAAAGLALAWLVTRPILGDIQGLAPVDFSNATDIRVLVGAVLFLMAIAMFSLGIGSLIRATAGGIFSVVAILMVLPMIFQIILFASNAQWAVNINKFLPSVAGEQIYSTGQAGGMMANMELLDPWVGFAVLMGYALLAFLAAFFTLRNRDA